jgi:hypothetical protein
VPKRLRRQPEPGKKGMAAQKDRRHDTVSVLWSASDLLRSRLGRDSAGIQFFSTPVEAQEKLDRVLNDEPDWHHLLYIEPIELVTGGLNSERVPLDAKVADVRSSLFLKSLSRRLNRDNHASRCSPGKEPPSRRMSSRRRQNKASDVLQREWA